MPASRSRFASSYLCGEFLLICSNRKGHLISQRGLEGATFPSASICRHRSQLSSYAALHRVIGSRSERVGSLGRQVVSDFYSVRFRTVLVTCSKWVGWGGVPYGLGPGTFEVDGGLLGRDRTLAAVGQQGGAVLAAKSAMQALAERIRSVGMVTVVTLTVYCAFN